MNNNEIWKPINGYNGIYSVSNFGKIKRLKGYRCNNDRILKQSIRRGHLFVTLSKDGVSNNCYVHRLVAEAFLPNDDNLPIINHKDENPQNNRVDNLEWCDYQYNNTYGHRLEKSATKNSKPIVQYDLNMNKIKTFPSITMASKTLNIPHSNIIKCLNHERNKAGGYIWKYNS